jgi:hypothetical protein
LSLFSCAFIRLLDFLAFFIIFPSCGELLKESTETLSQHLDSTLEDPGATRLRQIGSWTYIVL